jgi:GR25 family glycosyltransferase involved in LPS biosynthesis
MKDLKSFISNMNKEYIWFILFIFIYIILMVFMKLYFIPYFREKNWQNFSTNQEKLDMLLNAKKNQDMPRDKDMSTNNSSIDESQEENKKVCINLNNVPIYIINLRRSHQRIERIKKEFQDLNISKWKRIEAFDGANNFPNQSQENQELTLYCQEYDVTFKLPSKISKTRYEIACCFSHLLAILNAYRNGDEHVIIAEDDVSFNLIHFWDKSLLELMRSADNSFDKKWSLISIYNGEMDTSDKIGYFQDLPDHKGTVAYLINWKGMKNVLSVFDSEENVFDLTKINPNYFVSDVLIYRLAQGVDSGFKTLRYSKSLVYTYNDTNSLGSTIHNSHILRHLSASNKIIEYYSSKNIQ